MVAVEQPRADCGHASALSQKCGRCLRWCCPECYSPWTALACGDCRAEAQAGQAARVAEARAQAASYAVPSIEVRVERPGGDHCRGGGRSRRGGGGHRSHDREPSDVRALAARVADLERRLQELRPRF